MWGAWGGGIEFRLTVSGSGIFAGRLMVALVPPGVDASTIRNPGGLPHAFVISAFPLWAFEFPIPQTTFVTENQP